MGRRIQYLLLHFRQKQKYPMFLSAWFFGLMSQVFRSRWGIQVLLIGSYSKNSNSLSSSVAQSCPTLCNRIDCITSGLPVHHQLLESTQTHVHWVADAIQPSHPLLSPSPSALNLSQNQGVFKWVSSSHQVAEVLALQLQHQSFQWIFRTDFL